MQVAQMNVSASAKQILEQVGKVIVGKGPVLRYVLAAVLSGGHILVEDIPGVGKTTMAVAFSKVLDLQCSRVQFTPDVLPSDVTGYSVPNAATGQMEYKQGAVLCNLFLADELNRATSRTQSALLEAMEEGQVTVDGVVHKLPEPFVVIATQNPTGAAGTQLLPDSQIDRFAIRVSLGYPGAKEEKNMVLGRQGEDPLKQLQPLMSRQELMQLRQQVANTYVSEQVVEYVVALVGATRSHEKLQRGASPRATLSVVAFAKALARLQDRDYVVPRDVQEAFAVTVPHRLQLTERAENAGATAGLVVKEILGRVGAPAVR